MKSQEDLILEQLQVLNGMTLSSGFSEFLSEYERLVKELRELCPDIEKILEDMELSPQEFERLVEVVEQLATTCDTLRMTFKTYEGELRLLKGVWKKLMTFVGRKSFVKDFYKSLSGDYVHFVEQDELFFLDTSNLVFLIEGIENLCVETSENRELTQYSTFSALIETYITQLSSLTEWFRPNLAYISLPDSVLKIQDIAVKIDAIIWSLLVLRNNKFFDKELSHARDSIASFTEKFQQVPSGESLKLKVFLFKKKDTANILELTDALSRFSKHFTK